MSYETVRKTDKCKKRASKFVKVICKRLQPFQGIFKEKSEQISKSVVSFKNHTINILFDSQFIRFRQNRVTVFSIDDIEHNQIELITKYVCFVKSPFVGEQIIFKLSKDCESNSQSLVLIFFPLQDTTLDLEMAQLRNSTSEFKRNQPREKYFVKSYPKYLPVTLLSAGTSDSTYLRTEVDLKAPMCWLDIQAWYVKQKQLDECEINNGVAKSKSDSVIECNNTSDAENRVHTIKITNKARLQRKFKYSAAVEYIENATKVFEDSVIELVLQMTKEFNVYQYQLRTELLVDCLKFFCVPHETPIVKIHWVPSISEYLAADEIEIKNCQCVVKIDGPASILLKNRELAVWDTLGFLIGVNPKHITLL